MAIMSGTHLCADGTPNHDFKGQAVCPGCGWTGLSLSTDQRQRFVAAANRGLKWRRDRLNGWRVLLMTMHQAMGHRVKWHDYYPCHKCAHWWDEPKWIGPYILGVTEAEAEAVA